MYIVIALVIGMALGFVIDRVVMAGRLIGTLRIDRSDPSEPPYPFLEINKGVGGVDGISRHKFVLLTVKNENYIPQE